jgi:hypothetical protein
MGTNEAVSDEFEEFEILISDPKRRQDSIASGVD